METPSLTLIGILGGGYTKNTVYSYNDSLYWLQAKLRRILITPPNNHRHDLAFYGIQRRARENADNHLYRVKSLLAKRKQVNYKDKWSCAVLAEFLEISHLPEDDIYKVFERYINGLLGDLKTILNKYCKSNGRYYAWWRVRKVLDIYWLPRGKVKGNPQNLLNYLQKHTDNYPT